MRDIKFRAWDDEHKKWRFGWLTKLVEGVRRFTAIICDDEEGDLTRYYIHDDKTVGQYTGLKDKNGVEIYEGDLVEVSANKNGSFQVEFKNHYVGGWVLTNPSSEVWISLGARDSKDIEIIGNIHQNPESLE